MQQPLGSPVIVVRARFESLARKARAALSAIDCRLAIDFPASQASPRRAARAGRQEDDDRHYPDTNEAIVVKP